MDNRIGKVAWGLTLVAIGVLILLGTLDVIDARELFKVWWPMIIIIPSFFSFFSGGFGGMSLILLVVGILFQLNCLGILNGQMTKRLAIPVALVLLGMIVIIKGITRGHTEKALKIDMDGTPEFVGCFATRNETMSGMAFKGARLEGIFGTVALDLRDASFSEDTVINANATFGSAVVFLPENVNVKLHSSNFFGGVQIGRERRGSKGFIVGRPTIHVNTCSVFGGVKIR